MQIGIKVTGLEKVQAFLKNLPFLVRQKAAGWVAEYIIGDDSHGLKHYPAYKDIPRAQAYGTTFFTEKQRRWFFWALKTGQIHPGQDNRTGAYAENWKGEATGGGGYKITNSSPYAQYLGGAIGTDTRARQPALVGWRWVKDVVSSNLQGAYRHAQAKLKEWLKSQKANG